MSNIEEEARRLYPTSPRQRYMDKQMSKAQQRAYIRGHMHGRVIEPSFIISLVMDVHDNGMEFFDMIDHITNALEVEGFYVPTKREHIGP